VRLVKRHLHAKEQSLLPGAGRVRRGLMSLPSSPLRHSAAARFARPVHQLVATVP